MLSVFSCVSWTYMLFLLCRVAPHVEPLTDIPISNIMHPFDPITFRIEPLFALRNARTFVPAQDEPAVLPHVDSSNVIDAVMRVADFGLQLTSAVKSQAGKLVNRSGSETGLGLDDTTVAVTNMGDIAGYSDRVAVPPETKPSQAKEMIENYLRAGRVDFVLGGTADYLRSFTAHSAYWDDKDTILFMLQAMEFDDNNARNTE
eukprot:TRINITY_DN1872_c0_g1_i4.p2 TRINITY_DN1872_c0_g1~~TRINITY_DN1872_c0_g1_i4.p2  ORF type:complete len:203 (-),score=35.42 TRINITY_DN1872_c0_g1_i4:26-634(-)